MIAQMRHHPESIIHHENNILCVYYLRWIITNVLHAPVLADLGDLRNVAGRVDEDADALGVELSGHEGAHGQHNHLHVRPVGQDLLLRRLGRQPNHLRPRALTAVTAHFNSLVCPINNLKNGSSFSLLVKWRLAKNEREREMC